jgi:hypothetical protein
VLRRVVARRQGRIGQPTLGRLHRVMACKREHAGQPSLGGGVQCRARRQGHAVQLTLGRSHWIVSIGVGCFSQVGACRITHGLGHSVPQSHTRRGHAGRHKWDRLQGVMHASQVGKVMHMKCTVQARACGLA